MWIIRSDDEPEKIRIAYAIRGNGDFLVSGDTGNALYIPHEKATIVRAALTAEMRAEWADFLRADGDRGSEG